MLIQLLYRPLHRNLTITKQREDSMEEQIEVKELEHVVVLFSGDSGDGMQLAGNIFSNVSATVGNGISTFPDYPADIRAPQGSLNGVSGYRVQNWCG